MSIFKKIGSRIGKIGKGIGKAAKAIKPIIKAVAPIIAVIGPGKWLKAANIAVAVTTTVGNLLTRKKNGATMDNVFTRFVDATITAATSKAEGLEKIISFIPAVTAAAKLAEEIKDQDKTVWVPKLKEALDARIGSEPEALIGDHENALVKINVSWVPIETISDIAIDLLTRQLLKDESDSE